MKGQPLLLNQDKHHGYSIITLNENIENKNKTIILIKKDIYIKQTLKIRKKIKKIYN